jgi:hypothetical protein
MYEALENKIKEVFAELATKYEACYEILESNEKEKKE